MTYVISNWRTRWVCKGDKKQCCFPRELNYGLTLGLKQRYYVYGTIKGSISNFRIIYFFILSDFSQDQSWGMLLEILLLCLSLSVSVYCQWLRMRDMLLIQECITNKLNYGYYRCALVRLSTADNFLYYIYFHSILIWLLLFFFFSFPLTCRWKLTMTLQKWSMKSGRGLNQPLRHCPMPHRLPLNRRKVRRPWLARFFTHPK